MNRMDEVDIHCLTIAVQTVLHLNSQQWKQMKDTGQFMPLTQQMSNDILVKASQYKHIMESAVAEVEAKGGRLRSEHLFA